MSVDIKHQCAVTAFSVLNFSHLKRRSIYIADYGLDTNFPLGFIKEFKLVLTESSVFVCCLFVYKLERELTVCCHPNIKRQHLLGVSYRGHLHLIGNPTERETQWLAEKSLNLKVKSPHLLLLTSFPLYGIFVTLSLVERTGTLSIIMHRCRPVTLPYYYVQLACG